jgi:CDP-diacylglycerol---serine O-phosphatidyltransferase
MKLIKNLPNILTLFNLFLGCMAIVYIFNDHMVVHMIDYGDHHEVFNIELGNLDFASYCIFLAAIIDFFDGFVARLLKAQSPIGKQLDSLADMVTFGLVPGIIMYQLLSISYQANSNAFDYPIVYFAIGFAITLFAALRLAKFNIDERQTTIFRGLPVPSVAIIIASLPILIIRNESGIADMLANSWCLISIIIVLCYLMVSDIPMMSLKIKSLNPADNKWLYAMLAAELLLCIACLVIFKVQFLIIPLSIIVYILTSITKNISENGI